MPFLDESYSRDLELSQLLAGIEAGQVALPNFQRDFDWNDPDIASLLATVFSGWPAGSLLVMVGKPSFFDLRNFEGAPPVGPNPQYVVLDGQQRLTSLFHALRGTGKKTWCLRVDRAIAREPDAEMIEDALIAIDSKKFDSFATQRAIASGELLPLHFAANAADFYDWRDRILSVLDSEARTVASDNLTKLYRTIISTAHTYKFPAMMLQNTLEPAAIARIFERINKTGMRLSIFDLLVARSYDRGWNLRDVWIAARDEEPLLGQFCGEDGLVVIQAMALAQMGDIRRPALLKIDAESIRTEWDRYLLATTEAAKWLQDRGAADAGWLPYQTQLIPLAALAAEFNLDDHQRDLEAWLWGSSFSASYAVASSTVAADDYEKLRQRLKTGVQIETFAVSYQSLRGATKQNAGALWRTMRLFLRSRHARDLFSSADVSSVPPTEIEMETVMPKIDGHGGDISFFRSVLSLAVLDRNSVKRMRARPLPLRSSSEYDAEALASQLFATDPDRIISDPESFLRERFDNLVLALSDLGLEIVTELDEDRPT